MPRVFGICSFGLVIRLAGAEGTTISNVVPKLHGRGGETPHRGTAGFSVECDPKLTGKGHGFGTSASAGLGGGRGILTSAGGAVLALHFLSEN